MLVVVYAALALALLLGGLVVTARRRAAARRRLEGPAADALVLHQREPGFDPWENARPTVQTLGFLLALTVALGFGAAQVAHAPGAFHAVAVPLVALTAVLAFRRLLPHPVLISPAGVATEEDGRPWARVRGYLWIWDGRGIQLWFHNYGKPVVQCVVDERDRERLRGWLVARFGDDGRLSVDERRRDPVGDAVRA